MSVVGGAPLVLTEDQSKPPVRESRPQSGWSLLIRLAGIAMAAAVMSVIFGGFAMYWAAGIQNDQILDARLEQFGATLQVLVEDHLAQRSTDESLPMRGLKTRPTAALLYRYQVWSQKDHRLLMRSHEAPADRPLGAFDVLGYSTRRIDGEDYRVFSLPTHDGQYVLQVAENVDEAWSQVGVTTGYFAGFLLAPFALVLGVTWLLLRRALTAINTVADSLARRNPLDLTPLTVQAPPREIGPILGAIDMLFGRMQQALSIERSFTALAAHEMRTPLAGLRAQAQLLTLENLDAQSQETVRSLLQGVDRASHMLDQLLDLARIESLAMAGARRFEDVRLDDLFRKVSQDLATPIRSKRISLQVNLGRLTLRCHAFALGMLMRNLLSNAILYSPPAGVIQIVAQPFDHDVMLVVDDSGKGIPEAERERAFERFNRLGRTQADGVGLGLPIVLLVVELHRAKIQLADSPLGGLRVQVTFPKNPDSPGEVGDVSEGLS